MGEATPVGCCPLSYGGNTLLVRLCSQVRAYDIPASGSEKLWLAVVSNWACVNYGIIAEMSEGVERARVGP